MFVTQVEAAGRRRCGKCETPKTEVTRIMTDPNSTKHERWDEVRHEPRSAHLKRLPFALSEPLRKVDTWEDADSTAGGSRS